MQIKSLFLVIICLLSIWKRGPVCGHVRSEMGFGTRYSAPQWTMCLRVPELPARDSTVKTSRLFEWPHSIPTFGSCPIQPRMGHDHFDWKLLQTNVEMLPRLGHDSVLLNHFQPNIHRSSHHDHISIRRYWQRNRTQKKKRYWHGRYICFSTASKNNAIQLRTVINIAISI